jgi:hypothetical protein
MIPNPLTINWLPMAAGNEPNENLIIRTKNPAMLLLSASSDARERIALVCAQGDEAQRHSGAAAEPDACG